MKIPNKKSIINFIFVFIISFIIMEIIEHVAFNYFNINLSNLKYGWIGFMIIYGFKFHIFCCILPGLFTAYKCRHKKCKHCDHE